MERGNPLSNRELAFRVIAVVLGVAIPLGAIEGLAALALELEKRAYKPVMPEEVRASVNLLDRQIPTVPDPYLMYRTQPGIARERVQTNELGLREGPIDPLPAPGVVRILMIGGSVAWGYTANSNEDTIASYVEEELTRRATRVAGLRGQRFEVLNAGIPGYVAWQETLSYVLYLRHLAPAWVVALDGFNDVTAAIETGNAGVPMRYRLTENAYLAEDPQPGREIWAWLMATSRHLRVVKAFERLRPKPVEAFSPPKPRNVAAHLREAAAFLTDVARNEKARVLTVLQPLAILPETKPLSAFEQQIVRYHDRRMPGRNRYTTESYVALREELSALARERSDFHWLDATDVFSNTAEPTYIDECHLTPLGQRLLARRIADELFAMFTSGDGGPPTPRSPDAVGR